MTDRLIGRVGPGDMSRQMTHDLPARKAPLDRGGVVPPERTQDQARRFQDRRWRQHGDHKRPLEFLRNMVRRNSEGKYLYTVLQRRWGEVRPGWKRAWAAQGR